MTFIEKAEDFSAALQELCKQHNITGLAGLIEFEGRFTTVIQYLDNPQDEKAFTLVYERLNDMMFKIKTQNNG